jgi:protein AATF/BFR2
VVVNSEDESVDSEDENLGTEHYVAVGYVSQFQIISKLFLILCRTSKLRKPVEVPLGPQYAGARVSREELMNDDEDSEDESAEEEDDIVDPDMVNMDIDDADGEIDSDAALGESDSEKFKDFVFRGSGKPKVPIPKKSPGKRPTASDFMSGSEDEEIDEAEGDEDMNEDDQSEGVEEESEEESVDEDISDGGVQFDDDESGSDQEDAGSDEGSSEEDTEEDEGDDEDVDDEEQSRRAELRKMMSEEQKTVVATISQAAKADTEKGNAVKAQRKTFDSFLNVRIRLQKALVATNTLSVLDDNDSSSPAPYQAAEEAAIKLLNTLNAMRSSLSPSASKKRKHTDLEPSTPSTAIWATLQTFESQDQPKRQATLEKWSAKVRSTTAVPVSRKLNQAAPQTITSVLADTLSNSERLVKRTQTSRSCAPVQVSRKITEDSRIYDDADFYQLLLKELVDQRMVDTAAAGAGGAQVPQWTAVKEAKTRRSVDTKASKGRKMRFTVHEKLQNFMAPEDRGMWEPEAIDRFFGTLLGQRMGLAEGESDVEDEEEGKLDEEEALMLFRS